MTITRMFFIATPWLALTLASGCGEVNFKAVSTAPPSRVGTVDNATHRITLSRGVALAIECTSKGDGHYGPCDGMSQEVDDLKIADVLPADVDQLRQRYERYEQGTTVDSQPAAIFVVVGKTPGTTSVRVSTEHGGASLTVEVLKAP